MSEQIQRAAQRRRRFLRVQALAVCCAIGCGGAPPPGPTSPAPPPAPSAPPSVANVSTEPAASEEGSPAAQASAAAEPAKPTESCAPSAASAEVSTAPESGAPPPASAHAGHHTHGYAKDFSAAPAYAARFDAEGRDAWQKPDEVVALLALSPGARVADLGAGTGYFLEHLSHAAGESGRVLALDTEPNMVRYMAKRVKKAGLANVEVRRVAADDPGLEASSVDRILIVNTWHHISNREAYAAKLRDALRKGGAVVIVDFTQESDLGPPAAHRIAPEAVVRELSAGGLRARIASESLPKQYVVFGERRKSGSTPARGASRAFVPRACAPPSGARSRSVCLRARGRSV